MRGWSSLKISKRVSVSTNGIVAGQIVGSDAIFAGVHDDSNVKFERATLRRVWKQPSRGMTPLLLHDGLLIVKSAWNKLGALRADSGELAWTREAFGAYSWRRRLVLLPSGSAAEIIEPQSGVVEAAISIPADGGYLWGDILLCGDAPIIAYDLNERRRLWERDLLADMKSQHGVDDQSVVMGLVRGSVENLFIATRGGATFGCSLEDGRIRWCCRVPVPHRIPEVNAGKVFVALGDRFIAIDEATGTVIYDVTHEELKGGPTRSAAYRPGSGAFYGETLAIPHESGHLPVFNLEDGRMTAFYMSEIPLWRAAEADGRLLVGTGDGRLLVFGP